MGDVETPRWKNAPFSKVSSFLSGLVTNNQPLARSCLKPSSVINTLFLQIGVSMSSLFSGTDRISLRLMPFKPHEWLFKLQKWAFKSFKTRTLRAWDL